MDSIVTLQTGLLAINTYIVPLCNDAVFVVDPAACSLSNDEYKIIDYIKKNGKRLVAIFLTHGHFDHITGLGVLKKEWSSAPIAIHEKETDALAGSKSSQIPLLQMWGMEEVCSIVKVLPKQDITFSEEKTLDNVFQNIQEKEILDSLRKWKIINTPGHSPGSVCLYNADDKILISGDTMFYHSWGRTDLPGGNEDQMMNSLRMLINTLPDDTVVYPGHEHYGFTLGSNF